MVYEGTCRLGDLFESRREKGRPGLPLMSVTMNDGLVDRDDLERKQETSLSPEEHLLVKQGDIAYNMMRMWQGAFGLATGEGLVSPAYVVLSPRADVDPLYASYLLQSSRLRYLLWAYSYGMTKDRLRLYFDDFARIPAVVPGVEVQQRIGKLFEIWDRAIAKSERLLEIERLRAKDILNVLLTGSCNKIKRKQKKRSVLLRDIAKVISSSVDKHHVAGEQTVLVCNYTDVYYNRHLRIDYFFESGTASAAEIERFALRANDVVITKDSEEANDIGVASCVIGDVKDLVCGYHLAIVRPNERLVDGVFLAASFNLWSVRKHLTAQANGVTRFGLTLKAIESVQLELPSLGEQHSIRKCLLALEANLILQEKALAKLKSEKRALEQRIFGHEIRKRMAYPWRAIEKAAI